jgi:hypothetical protein
VSSLEASSLEEVRFVDEQATPRSSKANTAHARDVPLRFTPNPCTLLLRVGSPPTFDET